MKKSDFDFTIPQRQSFAAIVFIAYRFFRIVVRQIWPILIAFLIGREQTKTFFLILLAVISIAVFIFSVISYFRHYYYTKGDEIIIQKGVFRKTRINIPFQRIQTINFEQNVLHQILNVVKMEIDTAGSKGTEMSFSALEAVKADALRNMILERRSHLIRDKKQEEISPMADQVKNERLVMKLSVSELIRIGIAQNHLKSFVLILAFFMTIYYRIEELGIDADELVSKINDEMILVGKIAVISVAVLSIIVSFFYSLIRTILKYFDLKFIRINDGFKIISGLFNRKQVSARDSKIQMIKWADNPLKRLMGIFDVSLSQASSIEVSRRNSLNIPGCSKSNIEVIKKYYFREREWSELNIFNISQKIIYFRSFYYGFFPAIASILIFYKIGYLNYWWISIGWMFFILISNIVRQRKWRISVNEQILYVQHGLFGNFHRVLKLYKIQNISLKQTIYQRRNKLADIVIHTASGSIRIPFVSEELANKLTDYFVFKVESDKRSWM
jgi:putative membrane protein